MDKETVKYLKDVFANERKLGNYAKDMNQRIKNLRTSLFILSISCIAMCVALVVW